VPSEVGMIYDSLRHKLLAALWTYFVLFELLHFFCCSFFFFSFLSRAASLKIDETATKNYIQSEMNSSAAGA